MRSKSFILLALLTVFSFISKAQSLTLEQTVEYINKVIKDNSKICFKREKGAFMKVREVKVDKSGSLTFLGGDWWYPQIAATSTFNIFDLETGIWEIDKTFSTESVLKLVTKNNILIGFLGDIPTTEGNRLFKALMHLKNVCNKSADPFGN